MPDPTSAGLAAAAKVVSQVDPNSTTQIPNWVWITVFLGGMAGAYLLGLGIYLVKSAIDKIKPAAGASSQDERHYVTTDAFEEFRDNCKGQINDVRSTVNTIDKRIIELDRKVWDISRDQKRQANG